MVRVGMVGTLVGFGIVSLAYGQVADQVRSRQKISLMESVLESAVANGADNLLREVRTVLPPDALMLTGAPQARGFRLDGYGLFFDVEVPAFRRTMAWTLRTMVDEHGLALANSGMVPEAQAELTTAASLDPTNAGQYYFRNFNALKLILTALLTASLLTVHQFGYKLLEQPVDDPRPAPEPTAD